MMPSSRTIRTTLYDILLAIQSVRPCDIENLDDVVLEPTKVRERHNHRPPALLIL